MLRTLVLISLLAAVNGHGRLIDPPSRSSAWRFGYGTPTNTNDNALYCGGVGIQYGRNGGKCGVCGDAYDAAVKDNEAGGKYATGVIVKSYQPGATIPVVVDITANHQGYFKFSICKNDNPKKAATESCFQTAQILGHGEKMYIGSTTGKINAQVSLPEEMTCTQCVFRWIYTAENSWGTNAAGESCRGCGNNEQFYGCADIAITEPKIIEPPTKPPIIVPTPMAATKSTGGGGNPEPPTKIIIVPTPVQKTMSTSKVPVPPTKVIIEPTPAPVTESTSATPEPTTEAPEVTTLAPATETTSKTPEPTTTSPTVTTVEPTTKSTTKAPEPSTKVPTAEPTTKSTTKAPEPSTSKTTTRSPPPTPETTISKIFTTTRKPLVKSTMKVKPKSGCYSVMPFKLTPGMDGWCITMCAVGVCPRSHCRCSK